MTMRNELLPKQLKCYYDKRKNHFPFFLQILKACLFDTSLAKSYPSKSIQRLFSLSKNLGFHGPPLLTFKTDRLDFRGLDRG